MQQGHQRQVIWDDHPSIWQYTPAFLTVLLIIVLGHATQTVLYPYPWHAVTSIGFPQALTNIAVYWKIILIYLIYFAMVVGVLQAIYLYIKAFRTRYQLVDDQLIIRRFSLMGIAEERTELYRIVDFTMTQSLLGVLFKFSHIRLLSTDRARHVIRLSAVRNGPTFLDLIRRETERCRQAKGVREFTSGVVGDIDDEK